MLSHKMVVIFHSSNGELIQCASLDCPVGINSPKGKSISHLLRVDKIPPIPPKASQRTLTVGHFFQPSSFSSSTPMSGHF